MKARPGSPSLLPGGMAVSISIGAAGSRGEATP